MPRHTGNHRQRSTCCHRACTPSGSERCYLKISWWSWVESQEIMWSLSSVLWDSPDGLPCLEPQRQVSGRPARVLFHSGRQNSCCTAAALANITPRMDLDPNRKGLIFPDLKELRGFRAVWDGEEGTGKSKNWNDTQSQEGGPRLREESPPGTLGSGMRDGGTCLEWLEMVDIGGYGRNAGSRTRSCTGWFLTAAVSCLASTSFLLLPRPRLALLI